MPYVWECPIHGKQAISFDRPEIENLEIGRIPECPIEGCGKRMGFTYRD